MPCLDMFRFNFMNASFHRSVVVVALTTMLAGCVDPYGQPNYTGSGALIGGGSGALLGAAIDRRNPAAGALIGGAAGLLTGSLIGHSMDDDARRRYYYQPPPVYVPPPPAPVYVAPPPQVPPPSLSDIKAMARSGVSEDVIMSQITRSHAVYSLDANAIIDLKNAGVSDAIVHLMMMSASDTVVSQPPPNPPVETIAVAPGPDYYWCRGEWSWTGSAWVWVPGRWVAPPRRGAIWVETYWVRGPHGWSRVSGHWR